MLDQKDENMTEIGNWIPILSLLIAFVSSIVAILTYLRASRKYFSKALQFQREIKPKEGQVIFAIKGSGLLQKIEMTANGHENAIITVSVDNSVFMGETFHSLADRESKYLSEGSFVDGDGVGQFNLEMDLQKNFFKNIELSIDNKHETRPFNVKGTVHYNMSEPRFRFRSKLHHRD